MVPTANSAPARAVHHCRVTDTTSATIRPSTAWARKRGPMVGM
jgi:hypothetical protein